MQFVRCNLIMDTGSQANSHKTLMDNYGLKVQKKKTFAINKHPAWFVCI